MNVSSIITQESTEYKEDHTPGFDGKLTFMELAKCTAAKAWEGRREHKSAHVEPSEAGQG